MKEVSSFQKKIAEEPINLPVNPFFDVLRTFGRDELISLVINVIATAIISKFIFNNLILSISGPIIEKVGFFVAYFKEAWTIYRTTQKESRDHLSKYIFKAIRQGTGSLLKDIAFHDPTYTVLMFTMLQSYPQTPAWMISALSFFVAVGAVALGEVSLNEILYLQNLKKLKKLKFSKESYLESRFIVDDNNSEKILLDLSERFNLYLKESIKYQDRYFDSTIKGYNARTPKLRLRKRINSNGETTKTIQIVYTCATEMAIKRPVQFNYYPTRKDKLWHKIEDEMPWLIENIEEKEIKKYLTKFTKKIQYHDVYFDREICRDPKTILVSIDHVSAKDNLTFTIVEIKSHMDNHSKGLLIEAMRHLMLNYPVIQTTHTKSFLSSLNS